jgi:adenylate kinase family enzyme
MAFPYTRLVVIGTTSTGKSTLAWQLAEKLGLDFVELDALYWRPNWTPIDEAEFLALVDDATRTPRWVVAGNYSAARRLVWPRAQAVLWLDYPLWTIFWRLTFRIFRRWWSQELLWGTNYELLSHHFKLWSDESLWHWLFKTYWRRKREIPQLLASSQFSHLVIFHFKTPAETEAWFAGL